MADPNSSRPQWYPVYWQEGMFLRPHHLQAADRHAAGALTASEDWYHPFTWGFRKIGLDRDALRNREVVLHACEARLRDGTKVSIPADGVPAPIRLEDPRPGRERPVEIRLGVPRIRDQEGRSNVEPDPTRDGPRYWIQARRIEDDNTGDNGQEIAFRRLRCRLLLAGQPCEGYETLPLARVILSEEGTPMLDPGFVPPLLIMDAFNPLVTSVRGLHRQISSHIDTLVAQLADTGRLYEAQDAGQAERVLKLALLNGAFSHLGSVAYTHGMTPLAVYQELCRLAGHLAIFTPARRPGNMPEYQHDDLGGCFAQVIEAVRRGLNAAILPDYEMRYFEERSDAAAPTGLDRLRVDFDPDWRALDQALFLGVKGVDADLAYRDCEELLRGMDMKLGGASRVESDFDRRLRALQLVPIAHERPRYLPGGFVYYRIEGRPADWQDVVQSRSLVLRFNPSQGGAEVGAASSVGERVAPGVVRVLKVAAGDGDPPRKICFALFVV